MPPIPYCLPFTIVCHFQCLLFPIVYHFSLSFPLSFIPIICHSSLYATPYCLSFLIFCHSYCLSFTIVFNSPLLAISYCLSFPVSCVLFPIVCQFSLFVFPIDYHSLFLLFLFPHCLSLNSLSFFIVVLCIISHFHSSLSIIPIICHSSLYVIFYCLSFLIVCHS